MVSIIGFISGFFVAAKSIEVVYDAGFEKHNIEDGNFEYVAKASEEAIENASDIIRESMEGMKAEKEKQDNIIQFAGKEKDVEKDET